MRRRGLLQATASSIVASGLAGCFDVAGTNPGPDPDHNVRLDNEHDETHAVGVTVSRIQADVVVYDAEHELAPGASTNAYNLQEANPDGIESFEVVGRLAGETTTTTVETSKCHGDVWIKVSDDGELHSYHAIC